MTLEHDVTLYKVHTVKLHNRLQNVCPPKPHVYLEAGSQNEDRVDLNHSDPPALASRILGLLVCASMSGKICF